ncbi:bacteriohemerythrin [Pseudomonadota bacterium]
MKAVKWSADLSVGIEEIDDEHRNLVICIDDLFTACFAGQGPQVLGGILKRLQKYTREHFAHEEDFMRKIKYPGLAEHRAIHTELVSELDDIIDEFKASNSHELSNKTLQFLEDWLTQHIMIEDRKIGKYVGVVG